VGSGEYGDDFFRFPQNARNTLTTSGIIASQERVYAMDLVRKQKYTIKNQHFLKGIYAMVLRPYFGTLSHKAPALTTAYAKC